MMMTTIAKEKWPTWMGFNKKRNNLVPCRGPFWGVTTHPRWGTPGQPVSIWRTTFFSFSGAFFFATLRRCGRGADARHGDADGRPVLQAASRGRRDRPGRLVRRRTGRHDRLPPHHPAVTRFSFVFLLFVFFHKYFRFLFSINNINVFLVRFVVVALADSWGSLRLG